MMTPHSFTVKISTGHIEILEKIVIEDKDGNLHETGNHRRVLSPGDDTSDEHDLIKRHAARHWTPEVVAAHRARIELLE